MNRDDWSNVPPQILEKMGRRLHLTPQHPLSILRQRIHRYFKSQENSPGGRAFLTVDDVSPVTSAHACFDALLVPVDHVSRSKTDTYYFNAATMLRTHCTAHTPQLLAKGESAFLVSGDVYRRDAVDRSHYPVFHQMDGARMFVPSELGLPASTSPTSPEMVAAVEAELKRTLEGLVVALFGNVQTRWDTGATFPFTHPSYELEVLFQGEWLEVLGCGVIQRKIVEDAQRPAEAGWAFGLGLERLAMVLFDIPDIRLFWSSDARFRSQFDRVRVEDTPGKHKFVPFSKYPACYKDVAFWLPPDHHDNTVCEVVREIAGDLAENVECVDTFAHPKTGRVSKCFRIMYRSMERSLTNEEIDVLQSRLRTHLEQELRYQLR